MTKPYARCDAMDLAAQVAAGETRPDALLDEALARVDAVNPALNAVVHLQAETARAAIGAGLPGGPLSGVPFLLKDLGAEARAFPTSNGSQLTPGSRWSYDSEIYLRLASAGLVTFGRTTSPEFGIGPVTEARVYGGPTRNPWNTARSSGGSSGGAAAAVAAGIVPAAHGSDGGGSVRIPAACCGLVGFKPTRGRLPDGPASGEGWAGMAIDGFLTRSLRDSACLLDCVAGPDLGAPYWPPPMSETYGAAMTRSPGRLRVGVVTGTFSGDPIHPDCAAAVEKTARVLGDLGHDTQHLVPDAQLDVPGMMRAWTRIVACGTALSVRDILKGAPVPADKLEGVTRGALALGETLSGADYLEAVEEIQAFGRRMAQLLQGVDVVLSATLAAPPIEVGQLKPDHTDFMAYRTGPGGVFDYSPFTAIFNASGQPAVSLPLGWTADDLPVGVHLAMGFGQDAALMALAAQLEQAMPWDGKQQALISDGGVRT